MTRAKIGSVCLAVLLGACGSGEVQPADLNAGTSVEGLGSVSLPGRVQAEDFRPGGEGVGYHDSSRSNIGGQYRAEGVDIELCRDTGGGYDVSWVEAGEWLAYDVVVAQPGRFTFTARIASGATGAKSLHLEIDGKPLPATSFNGGAGWQNWQNLALGQASLSVGKHVLKMVFDSKKLNLNYVDVGFDCVPTTCAAAGAQCGSVADGCGGTLECGSCAAPMTCGGAGTPNVCSCTPKTCSALGAQCGSVGDGCGGTLACGSCVAPMTCGGAGTANACGCTPKTCSALGAECGSIGDGCGGTLSCGGCEAGEVCTENVCAATQFTFAGSMDAATASWKTHTFLASAGDAILATLDWADPAANLNLYLYDPAGAVVKYGNTTTAKPEIVSFTATVAGTWKLGIKCATGSTGYALDLTVGAGAPPPPPPPATVRRFPGDPGVGKIYIGGRADQLTWSDNATAWSMWSQRMGGRQMGIARCFGSPSVTNGMTSWTEVDWHHSQGRLPHISFKLPAEVTQDEGAANAADMKAWSSALAAKFKARAPKPIWYTFWHEPENDTASISPANYRAIARNLFLNLREAGVTNVAHVTTAYMTPYTFQATSGRDWRQWYPDWKGTTAAGSSKDSISLVDFYSGSESVVDMIGLDVYSWWGEGESLTSWDSYAELAGMAHSRMDVLGKPYVIPEHGVQAYHTGTVAAGTAVFDAARTLTYLRDMYTYMLQHNTVAMEVFNYAIVEEAWRLEVEDPQGIRYQGYGAMIDEPTTVLPDL